MEIAPPAKTLAEPKQIENRANVSENTGELDFGGAKKPLAAE